MDADILKALKDERDHSIFARRAEQFVRRWAPNDPREQWEFTGELMSLFRDMVLTQQHVHSQVAQRYFEQHMGSAMLAPIPIIINKKDDPK